MFQGPRQIVDVTARSPVSMSTRGTPRVVAGEKDNLSVLLYDTFDTETVQNRILGTVDTSGTSAVFMSPPPLRWENRAGARSGVRVTGLEMPWNPGTNLVLGPNDSNLF